MTNLKNGLMMLVANNWLAIEVGYQWPVTVVNGN